MSIKEQRELEDLKNYFKIHIINLRRIADITEKQLPSKFFHPLRRAFFKGRIAALREEASNLEDIMNLWV